MDSRLNMANNQPNPAFTERLLQLPHGSEVLDCINCGTCSASCPTRNQMDLGPRRIMQMAKLGYDTTVLSSNTLWLCTSCFMCENRCPRELSPMSVIKNLRLMAHEQGKDRWGTGHKLDDLFSLFNESISEYGRTNDCDLAAAFYRRNFRDAVGQLGLVFALRSRKRMKLIPPKPTSIQKTGDMDELFRRMGGK